MGLTFHPVRGSIVTVNFEPGFTVPEMVKRRLAVVISPAIRSRPGLCTVVPLSTTPPEKAMPYHCTYTVPFDMPKSWGNIERWVKGDMVTTVGWHRVDLLFLGKDQKGKRIYQTQAIDEESFLKIKRCALHGMGFSTLTKHL
jgi:mRNA interferase MazF